MTETNREDPNVERWRPVELVAHRAGNTVAGARQAKEVVDLVELDVHVFRGLVEVRHEKVLRPTSRLWEKWYLLPRGTRGVPIEEILEAVGPQTRLLVDLKCWTRRAARRIKRSLPAPQPVTVASRSWWVLGEFSDRPSVRMLRSCGNRLQLWLVRRVPGLGDRVGVVIHERLLDATTVRALTVRTSLVFCWGVTEPERGRDLVEAGVSGLIVDDLSKPWSLGR